MGYRKAVIIGAGKIGRGLIAGILRTNGIEYCFIETDPALIRQFRENSQYLLHILGGREQIIPMRTVPIYALFETAEIEKRLLEADLIFTAVGGRNLREVGEFLGERLEHILPERSWARALNMIVHENWKYKDSDLSENIQKKLSKENQSLFQDMVGICTAISMGLSVDPVDEESRKREPLGIWMQDQWSIFVNKAGYKGDLPKIKGIGFVDQFLQLQSQALYTNNASSAVISYIGWLKGYQYVSDAAHDPEIETLLDQAYREIEAGLVRGLHIFPKDQQEFARRAKEKYQDIRIRDTVKRHARDPLRKLAPDERLLAPARMAVKSGMEPKALAAGIAAALYYEDPEDESACRLAALRREKGEAFVLHEICGLEKGEPLEQLILAQLPWIHHLFCQERQLTK